jgi:hypothetical protein
LNINTSFIIDFSSFQELLEETSNNNLEMTDANRGPFSLPKNETAAIFGRITSNTTSIMPFLEIRDAKFTKKKLVKNTELIASFQCGIMAVAQIIDDSLKNSGDVSDTSARPMKILIEEIMEEIGHWEGRQKGTGVGDTVYTYAKDATLLTDQNVGIKKMDITELLLFLENIVERTSNPVKTALFAFFLIDSLEILTDMKKANPDAHEILRLAVQQRAFGNTNAFKLKHLENIIGIGEGGGLFVLRKDRQNEGQQKVQHVLVTSLSRFNDVLSKFFADVLGIPTLFKRANLEGRLSSREKLVNYLTGLTEDAAGRTIANRRYRYIWYNLWNWLKDIVYDSSITDIVFYCDTTGLLHVKRIDLTTKGQLEICKQFDEIVAIFGKNFVTPSKGSRSEILFEEHMLRPGYADSKDSSVQFIRERIRDQIFGWKWAGRAPRDGYTGSGKELEDMMNLHLAIQLSFFKGRLTPHTATQVTLQGPVITSFDVLSDLIEGLHIGRLTVRFGFGDELNSHIHYSKLVQTTQSSVLYVDEAGDEVTVVKFFKELMDKIAQQETARVPNSFHKDLASYLENYLSGRYMQRGCNKIVSWADEEALSILGQAVTEAAIGSTKISGEGRIANEIKKIISSASGVNSNWKLARECSFSHLLGPEEISQGTHIVDNVLAFRNNHGNIIKISIQDKIENRLNNAKISDRGNKLGSCVRNAYFESQNEFSKIRSEEMIVRGYDVNYYGKNRRGLWGSNQHGINKGMRRRLTPDQKQAYDRLDVEFRAGNIIGVFAGERIMRFRRRKGHYSEFNVVFEVCQPKSTRIYDMLTHLKWSGHHYFKFVEELKFTLNLIDEGMATFDNGEFFSLLSRYIRYEDALYNMRPIQEILDDLYHLTVNAAEDLKWKYKKIQCISKEALNSYEKLREIYEQLHLLADLREKLALKKI